MRVAAHRPAVVAVPPAGYGGTELVLDTLCCGLAADGYDVLLYATGDSASDGQRALEVVVGEIAAGERASFGFASDLRSFRLTVALLPSVLGSAAFARGSRQLLEKAIARLSLVGTSLVWRTFDVRGSGPVAPLPGGDSGAKVEGAPAGEGAAPSDPAP